MEENVILNGFAEKHKGYCANVMQFLHDPEIPQYDIVIVDPPAFAKSLHKRHNAVQAYKRLNVLALKKVKNTGKKIRVVKSLSQGPDHPINLFHPEGHYLKGLMLYVEN